MAAAPASTWCFPRALVDPRPDQRDFRVAQWLFVLRHLGLDFSGQPMNHQAVGAVPRPDDGAVAAALERVGVGRERQATFTLVLAVTFEALFRDDRLHLPLVVHQWTLGLQRLREARDSCHTHTDGQHEHSRGQNAQFSSAERRPPTARSALTARSPPPAVDTPGVRACTPALASSRSPARILALFCVQHWFTALRHHSALRRDARIGLPSTMVNTGLVCDDGRMRAAIQLLRSSATSKVSVRSLPSATMLLRGDGHAVDDDLDRHFAAGADAGALELQYGFTSYASRRIPSFGCCGKCAAALTVTFTRPGLSRRTSLSLVPASTPLTLKSSRWLLPSDA